MIAQQTNADYHSDHSAWSKSMLWTFRERRSMAYARYVGRIVQPDPPSREMVLGTLVHRAVLEPGPLPIVTIPAALLDSRGYATTREAKAWRERAEERGLTVVTNDECLRVLGMAAALKLTCGRWLRETTVVEQSIYWDGPNGLRLKCRPDAFTVTKDVVVVLDVKTTRDCSPRAFSRSCEDYGYWLQHVHYAAGLQKLYPDREIKFVFIAVDSEMPHSTAVYQLSNETIDLANMRYRDLVSELNECIETNDWRDPWQKEITQLRLRPRALEVMA